LYLAFVVSFVLYDYFTYTVDPQFYAFPAYVYLKLIAFVHTLAEKLFSVMCHYMTQHCCGYEQ